MELSFLVCLGRASPPGNAPPPCVKVEQDRRIQQIGKWPLRLRYRDSRNSSTSEFRESLMSGFSSFPVSALPLFLNSCFSGYPDSSISGWQFASVICCPSSSIPHSSIPRVLDPSLPRFVESSITGLVDFSFPPCLVSSTHCFANGPIPM